MDKIKILKAVQAELEEDLRRQQAANTAASAGATHGEAKAETKWDTCGLEQSYLARGHAKQFEALAKQIDSLRSFFLIDYADRPIGVGALIEAKMNEASLFFFLLECAGGIDVEVDGREITVITPESPVGAALLGKVAGDTYSFRAGLAGAVIAVE